MRCRVVIHIFFTSFVIFSCNTWKSGLLQTGKIDNARMNVILDFTNRHIINKKTHYLIENYTETEDLHVFTLLRFKPAPRNFDTIGAFTESFPTRYFESNNNLFLWYDKKKSINKEIIDVMQQYNAIDSTFIKDKNGYIIVSNKKASRLVFYFVCKEKISKYKRIKAGWIIEKNYPKIKCLE